MEKNSLSGQQSSGNKPGIHMNQYKSIDEKEVEKMVERYAKNVKKDPKFAIMQIRMDCVLLNDFMKGADRIVFLSAASKENLQTIILQLRRDGKKTYYNIRDVFKTDMQGKEPPVCPPPPDCGFPP
jgi:hypothetical protein